MTDETIENRIDKVVFDLFGVSWADWRPDAPIFAGGAISHSKTVLEPGDFDSLDAIEFVLGLQDEFGIKISDAEAEMALSKAGFTALVVDKVAQQRS